LYQLLPEIYRTRDVTVGEPLRAILAVLETELRAVEADVDALYANWFVETCDDWVLPYLADLLGVEAGDESAPLLSTQRSLVARTVRYRHWQGTLATLRDAARNATGWQVVVVEGFRCVAVAGSIRWPGLERGRTVDLRRQTPRVGAAGNNWRYLATIDDRGESAATNRAGYNLGELYLFVSRLQPYLDRRGSARRIQAGRYTCHPFGIDAPLLGGDENRSEWSFTIGVAVDASAKAELVLASQIVTGDLSEWRLPSFGIEEHRIVVDPVRGRLAFPSGQEPERVEVGYGYAFSADLGGGVYDRWSTLTQPDDELWCATVDSGPGREDPKVQRFATVGAALAAWAQSDRSGLIRVMDSRTYRLEPDGPAGATSPLTIGGGRTLAIEAANDESPCLVGNLLVCGDRPAARLRLNGLWIDGSLTVGGQLDLDLRHCTLRPLPNAVSLQTPSDDEPGLRVAVAWSIIGRIRLSPSALGLWVTDSIVDGVGSPAIAGLDSGFGPPTVLERATILGPTIVDEITRAVDCLFSDRVVARRTIDGEISTSFVPIGSQTPGRQRCQPDLALDEASESARSGLRQRLKPSFTSIYYGDPGYAQLSLACPNEIKSGSSSASEFGAFHHLRQADREARLRAVLADYLPGSLRPRVVYVT
jgi:phage tail-like protein